MREINQEVFILESDKNRVLKNITKYCSKCYKEFNIDDELFLNMKTYEYICKECACCLSEEILTNQECTIVECENESKLF